MNAAVPMAGPGHNYPPSDADLLRDRIAFAAADVVKRKDELIAAAARVPEVIDSDEIAGRVGDFIKQLTGAHKATEAMRVATKEPHLEASRIVDGFFKAVTDPLSSAKKLIEGRLTVFLRKKADEERRAREVAAAKAAAEAAEKERQLEKIAATASAGMADAVIDDTIAAIDRASQAARALDVKAADISRVRGDYGSVQSLRTTWDFEIEDMQKIPLDQLRPYLAIAAVEQAIRGFVKANHDRVPLPGVKIFENFNANVR